MNVPKSRLFSTFVLPVLALIPAAFAQQGQPIAGYKLLTTIKSREVLPGTISVGSIRPMRDTIWPIAVTPRPALSSGRGST